MKYPLIWLEKDVPKKEITRKFPHTLSLGKLGKGQSFNRIRQKSPILYRWVMNAVRYEGYR
ncbi:hypothetical protein R6K87_08800, partial [Enterococcus faecium]|uniref:hypothetical protein n=1 Tax=Enterococcus faecium TaxID=1352 RepID=UPI00296B13EE